MLLYKQFSIKFKNFGWDQFTEWGVKTNVFCLPYLNVTEKFWVKNLKVFFISWQLAFKVSFNWETYNDDTELSNILVGIEETNKIQSATGETLRNLKKFNSYSKKCLLYFNEKLEIAV